MVCKIFVAYQIRNSKRLRKLWARIFENNFVRYRIYNILLFPRFFIPERNIQKLRHFEWKKIEETLFIVVIIIFFFSNFSIRPNSILNVDLKFLGYVLSSRTNVKKKKKYFIIYVHYIELKCQISLRFGSSRRRNFSKFRPKRGFPPKISTLIFARGQNLPRPCRVNPRILPPSVSVSRTSSKIDGGSSNFFFSPRQ